MNNNSKMSTVPGSLKQMMEAWAVSNIETLDVAVVTDVSQYQDRLVSVLPLCIQEDPDGVSPAKPVIDNCPVILQGNIDGFSHFPLRKGDKVLIGYPKDSIEEFFYSKSADQYFPVDSLKFQGSQAVVLGAIGQQGVDKQLSTEDFEITYFESKVSISPDGLIAIVNGLGEFSIQPDGLTTIDNGSGTFSIQPDGLITVANDSGEFSIQTDGTILANGATIDTAGNVITALGADLDEIRSQLNDFRTAYISHGSGAPSHPPPPPYT